MAASIEGLLAEISDIEDPIEELQSLKTALLSIPLSTLKDTLSGQRFNVIFSLLHSNEREQVELCVEILERILLALSPVSLAQNYRVELQEGLTHPNETVKVLAVTQIGRMVAHPDAATEILNNHDILGALINCIGEENMAVAKQAIKSLSKLSHSKPGLDMLFQSDLLKVMKDVMATSNVVRYRIYEVCSTLCVVLLFFLKYIYFDGIGGKDDQ
ncbi:26S proteasome non-ATPase regulatory subunit 5-like [Anarrhichthys ocellatus]|uniref:26S proteasome non-ATPase regulatory subunit 5-like n=1 Tax=Anarrhichthys ocellatus TaxID=433405 RepID=UPI0012ED274F|nr:26S proteasome non-ATPase regulatory subunit 5-like [Anarrhichthys ocellatus]